MTAVTWTRGLATVVTVGVLGVSLLSGCGGTEGAGEARSASATPTTSTPTPSATPTPTPSPTPGPDEFVRWAKSSEMGDRDMSQASDEALLDIGNNGCGVIATQPSFGQAVADVTKRLASIGGTTTQVDAMLRQAVTNLCPQHADMVP